MNYKFTASAKSKTAELYLYDMIGEWGISARQVAADLRAAGDVSTILVRINSPGGDVFDGYAIYNQLLRAKASIEVDIDGMALSIASVIAMSGNAVRMAKNAMFMIHEPHGAAYGTAGDMRKTADLLDSVRTQIIDTYVARTQRPFAEIADWVAAETWFDAAQAAEAGFVDEVVGDLKIAACADLARFKNAPSWAQRRLTATATPNLDLRRAALEKLAA